MKLIVNNIYEILCMQLRNYWVDIDRDIIQSTIPETLGVIEDNYRGLPNKRLWDGGEVIFSPYTSVQWMNFLYRLSHILYLSGNCTTADQVYYLNKIMHSIDWFYAIDLPVHFLCEHPLGSVLGRADYGDYFVVYQGTTVGGNRSKGILSYPKIGKNVIMFANSMVLGDSTIGNNVVISAGTQIINDVVPDNCLVFGKSPNLVVKENNEWEIKKYTQHIWGWETER